MDNTLFTQAKEVDFFSELSPEEKDSCRLKTALAVEILKKRRLLGLSQADFASLFGMKQSTISKYETGNHNLSIQKLSELAVKLGLH